MKLDEVIIEGGPNALDEGFGGIISEELVQPPHCPEGLSSMALLEAVDETPEDLILSAEVLLLGAGLRPRPSSLLGAMLGLGDSLASSEG